jgi:uncharacterized protein YbcI
MNAMIKSNSPMAEKVAQAAVAFEQQRAGHAPKWVTVVMCETTLVITLHEALSPAEMALAKTPAGAARVQEFHHGLFANAAESMRQEIKRISGVEVREAREEIKPTNCTVVQTFANGTVVQVYLLACNVPTQTWGGNGSPDHQGVTT